MSFNVNHCFHTCCAIFCLEYSICVLPYQRCTCASIQYIILGNCALVIRYTRKNFYLKVFKVFSLYPPPSLLSTLFFVLSPPSIFLKQATWSHDPHPASVLSFATVLCHIILGCLTFHFPSRVHCDTEMSSMHFIHGTFPRHFQHLILALYS